MILSEIDKETVMTTITTPTSHTGGLVQLEIPQQWAEIPPILAAGGRRRPAARAPPGGKPEKTARDDDDDAMPCHAAPYHGISCHALPSPSHAIPSRPTSNCAAPLHLEVI